MNTKELSFNDFKITWIRDNKCKNIEPIDLYTDLTPEIIEKYNIKDGIEISYSTYLLEKDNKKALFDTGFGDYEMKPGYTVSRLKELNILPEQIDYIFITHSHPDHVIGLINKEKEKVYKKAKIYINKLEYEFCKNNKDDQSKWAFSAIEKYKDDIILFNFNDDLPLGVKPVEATGHTPGHTVYQIEKILVIGDLMHAAVIQFDHPEIGSIFDADKLKAIESRKKILKYAKNNNLIIAAMHFPAPALDYRYNK